MRLLARAYRVWVDKDGVEHVEGSTRYILFRLQGIVFILAHPSWWRTG